MAAFVKNSRQHEEATGRDSMSQHHKHRSVQTRLRKAEYSQHHKSQMADRRVGDQLLQIGLNHGDQRAINNANQRQRHDPRRIVAGLFGEQAEIKAQHSVRTHLQQHAGQQHGPGSGSLNVCVR